MTKGKKTPHKIKFSGDTKIGSKKKSIKSVGIKQSSSLEKQELDAGHKLGLKGALLAIGSISLFVMFIIANMSGGSLKSKRKIKLTKFEDFYDNIINKFFGKDFLYSNSKMYDDSLYTNTKYYSFFNDILYAKSKSEFPKQLHEDNYISISGKNNIDFVNSLLNSFRTSIGHKGGASKKLNYNSDEGVGSLSLNNNNNSFGLNYNNNEAINLVRSANRNSVRSARRNSVRSARRNSVRSANRNSVRSANRNSVRSANRNSVRNQSGAKVVEIEGLIIDYDPLSNTHLFMRENNSDLTEFCLLIDKDSFYENMVSKKDYLYSLINQNYVLPFNIDALFREYENLISQFLDFGKMQVLTEIKTNNSINNLKNISIFGSPFTISNSDSYNSNLKNNATHNSNNNRFYSAQENINSNNSNNNNNNNNNNRFFSAKSEQEKYELDNLSSEMFEAFYENYNKSLESYVETEPLNKEYLNEWGGHVNE